MKNDYLDLFATEGEAQQRERKFWLKEWLWMMLISTILFSILIIAVWLVPMGANFKLKVVLTSFSVLSWVWLGWNTSEKWRCPKMPENFLTRLRRAGQL